MVSRQGINKETVIKNKTTNTSQILIFLKIKALRNRHSPISNHIGRITNQNISVTKRKIPKILKKKL